MSNIAAIDKQIKEFVKTDKQKVAVAVQSQFKHTCLGGGSRSGKTFITVRNIVMRAMAVESRHLICRLHFSHVKSSIGQDTLPKVMKICFPQAVKGVDWWINKTDWYVEFKNGSQIWLAGTDEGERVDKILGTEYSTIYFNEASQFKDYDVISTLLTRLAENSGLTLKAFYDCNPPTKKHWIYKIFIDGEMPDTRDPVLRWKEQYKYLTMNPIDNLDNLPAEYLETLEALPKKQRERFLMGLFGSDTEGALWNQQMIDLAHALEIKAEVKRIVVGVDPAVSNNPDSDEWGIVVCALYTDGKAAVLADYSGKYSTDKAAETVIEVYKAHEADAVIAEVNQGGDLVEDVLRLRDFKGKFIPVRAAKGKFARAEPVSGLYEQELIKHASEGLDDLENEMTEWVPHETKCSPNRIDALVWAMFELFRLSEKSAVTVYRADFKPHKHVSKVNFVPIKRRSIVIGWGLGTYPAVVICQQLANKQVRVLDALVAEEPGLRRFAIGKVRALLKKKYKQNKFVSVGDPRGIEVQRGSDNERAAFDVLFDCGIPTEPAGDEGFEALSENARKYMQMQVVKGPAMIIDPRCQALTDTLLHEYKYNDQNKPIPNALAEAHQHALLEVELNQGEKQNPIISHHVVIDEAIGF